MLNSLQRESHPDLVLDDFDEAIDEPNFNHPNTSPEPPSPYADLEKKFRKNKFNKKKSTSYYPELYGTSGISVAGGTKASGNKSHKKRSVKAKRKTPSGHGRSANGR